MKTTRRGFFSAITGLAVGVYAAFVPGEAKGGPKPVDVTTMADFSAEFTPRQTGEYTIMIEGVRSDAVAEYEIYCIDEEGNKVHICEPLTIVRDFT